MDPNDPFALPGLQDISFDVNIGSDSADPNLVDVPTNDRNLLDNNQEVAILIEALDFASGSFHITGNRITDTNDSSSTADADGHGIKINLQSDLLPSEAVSFLADSVITNNVVGVDNQGNDGHGLAFSLTERTRIQDLEVTKNTFVNNTQDGFNFFRSEDGDLNSVIFESNFATNNGGDGFDLFAVNTVKDRMDFQVNSNSIRNNGQYGMRIDVQADARIAVEFNGNEVLQNGSAANGTGYHPNDGVAGSTGAAGGVGIHAFQQVEVIFNADNSQFDENFGDGFSIDAFNFFDTLTVQSSFTDSSFDSNTLTGFRNHGTSFGTFDFTRNTFNFNGEDGFRSVAIDDKTDFFDRRVGGQDLDVYGLGNQFSFNGESGAVLGMGVSAVLGNGSVTTDFANQFSGNGEDGLKVVQEAGPYLRSLGLKRVIQTDANFFTSNTGDGVDVGHFVANEGGNTEHGEEVISDVDVIVANAVITGNDGDGVEYLADDVFRIFPVTGGGQDLLPDPDESSLTVSNSVVRNNDLRGIDILNRVNEDSKVTLVNNEILSNGHEGIYVINTASHDQLQNASNDPLEFELGDVPSLFSPNIELRVQDNLIESNGTSAATSTVPISSSRDVIDDQANANADYTHDFRQTTGTLGGLVVRVGAVDSVGFLEPAWTDLELTQSGIDAEVWSNSFDGNIGADVYFDNFVSAIPHQSGPNHSTTQTPSFVWNRGVRDPLSRFDLSFRENSGNSLDVINGFAFIDNDEWKFKSRIGNGTADPEPNGPFPDSHGNRTHGRYRERNLTRTLGYFNNMGDIPSSQILTDTSFEVTDPNNPGLGINWWWAYDGWGTSTWRVESDFDFNNFTDTSSISGLSDFFDIVNLADNDESTGFIDIPDLAEEHYQWDTGQNVPGFVGLTPYSLQRGDIFNVQAGEDPIAADALEENDSFAGAWDLGTVTGPGFSVNALAVDSGGILNIERKGDRDYYKFVAGDTGSLDVNLGAVDALGDFLEFLIYEVDETRDTEEVPLIQAADGSPLRQTVNAGGNGTQTVNVVAGRTYIIEILSDESWRTLHSQVHLVNRRQIILLRHCSQTTHLTIDAPGVAPPPPPPVVAAPAPVSGATLSSRKVKSLAISIEDQDPTSAGHRGRCTRPSECCRGIYCSSCSVKMSSNVDNY